MLADNQDKLQSAFKAAFRRMTVLGNDESTLVDCSEVIPEPPPLPGNVRAHFPAGKTAADVEQAVSDFV